MDGAVSHPQPVVFHALPVGGGILALSALPGAGGDYTGDLEHLVSWRPAMVICMAQDHEMIGVGAGALAADVQNRGARWAQLAVEKGAAPEPEVQAHWPVVRDQARRALLGGGRVLMHCADGCGRSGMMALRLMIECGDAPDDALRRVAHVRGCALGSQAQVNWALRAERQAALFVRHAD